MKLDLKGLAVAGEAIMENKLHGDYVQAEAAILAYLKATDSVIVPRKMVLQMIVEDSSPALDELARLDQEDGLI